LDFGNVLTVWYMLCFSFRISSSSMHVFHLHRHLNCRVSHLRDLNNKKCNSYNSNKLKKKTWN
jgi:hypothetical protein